MMFNLCRPSVRSHRGVELTLNAGGGDEELTDDDDIDNSEKTVLYKVTAV